MPDEPRIMILACPPVSYRQQRLIGIREYTPSPGSVKSTCDRCFAAIWLGLKQQKFKLAVPETPKLCVRCVARLKGHYDGIQNLGGIGGTYKLVDGTDIKPQV